MGTANVLEAVRNTDTVRSLINVTTDKVYRNREWIWGYRENEELDGYDPYSNSKSCSELETAGADCTGDGGPHEANLLKLDCTKLKITFDWKTV